MASPSPSLPFVVTSYRISHAPDGHLAPGTGWNVCHNQALSHAPLASKQCQWVRDQFPFHNVRYATLTPFLAAEAGGCGDLGLRSAGVRVGIPHPLRLWFRENWQFSGAFSRNKIAHGPERIGNKITRPF